MKQNRSVTASNVQIDRRTLLKRIAALTSTGALSTTLPAFSATTGHDPTTTAPNLPVAIKGMLVSKTGTMDESLILQNTTSREITIKSFKSAIFALDNDIVDCNAACAKGSITLSANQQVLIQFTQIEKPAVSELIVPGRVRKLSEGTRVLPFVARLRGNTALLAIDSASLAA